MSARRVPGAITKLAFAEDAIAIASFAESQGFVEDARVMRDWARKVMAEIPQSRRWRSSEEVSA